MTFLVSESATQAIDTHISLVFPPPPECIQYEAFTQASIFIRLEPHKACLTWYKTALSLYENGNSLTSSSKVTQDIFLYAWLGSHAYNCTNNYFLDH